MLNIGTEAPDFETELDDGTTFRLSSLRGTKNVVFYFYPRDFTAGCTAQACSFRDNDAAIHDHDAVIIGVSTDTLESHRAFKAEYGLNFPMISDADGSLHRAYDVVTSLPLIKPRITYVIDKAGVIRGAFRHDILVTRHTQDALKTLEEIEGEQAQS
jgi:peroxiredoxin Q/BCP